MNELLSPESWVDGHEQYHIDIFQHVLDRFYRCMRVQDDTRFDAKRTDQLNGPVQMRTSLYMDSDKVSACFCKLLNIKVRIFDHQMDIHRQFGQRTDGIQDNRPKRNIWYEMAVHNIHMDPICSCSFHFQYFFSKFGKIGC